MKRFALLLSMVMMLWLAARASAMTSTNYRLDWFTPLTTAGGGQANSANYSVNFSIGQAVVNSSASSNYVAALGYWPGTQGQYRIYLPVVLR
jgi:hypothetical protein